MLAFAIVANLFLEVKFIEHIDEYGMIVFRCLVGIVTIVALALKASVDVCLEGLHTS